jgi:hypothetical protein
MSIGSTYDNKYCVSGGVVGVCVTNKVAVNLIRVWKQASLIEECIIPQGSSRLNHRQDQAIITILLHRSYQKGLLSPCNQRLLSISIHNDIEGY